MGVTGLRKAAPGPRARRAWGRANGSRPRPLSAISTGVSGSDESPGAFTVVRPHGGEIPVVVEVPHAGLAIDAESLAWTVAPARSLAADADLYVDELARDTPAEGATLLVAHTSRYVVDLNRDETDCDSEAVDGAGAGPWPRGVVWRLTTEGDPILARRLSKVELERRLDGFYRPYHRALAELLAAKRARFGHAILVCAHSMPSRGRPGHADPGDERADIVPGTRGRSTAAPAVIDGLDRYARGLGLSVRHDDPYRGGFSTGHYGRPHEGLHAVQIEIARRRYMDEATFRRNDGFPAIRAFLRGVVRTLGALPSAALGAPAQQASSR